MTELDRRPPTTSVGVAVLCAMLAAAATAATSAQGGAGVAVGALLVAVGLVRRSRAALSWGVAVGAAGLVFAATTGSGGGGEIGLLTAAVTLAVAWDVGDHALSLGDAVGRNARSARNQFVHAGTSALVGTLAAGVAYGTYVAAAGGQPVAALVFLLFGAVALVSAFR